MNKKPSAKVRHVMRTHSIVFALTFTVPFICWVSNLLQPAQCFALIGTGLFILSGHTIAFFPSYLEYLREKDAAHYFDEAGLKKFLKFGIVVDFLLAFLFYSMGFH